MATGLGGKRPSAVVVANSTLEGTLGDNGYGRHLASRANAVRSSGHWEC